MRALLRIWRPKLRVMLLPPQAMPLLLLMKPLTPLAKQLLRPKTLLLLQRRLLLSNL